MADLVLDQNILPNLEGIKVGITNSSCYWHYKALKKEKQQLIKIDMIVHGPNQKVFVA